jgi:hypothetical protein
VTDEDGIPMAIKSSTIQEETLFHEKPNHYWIVCLCWHINPTSKKFAVYVVDLNYWKCLL